MHFPVCIFEHECTVCTLLFSKEKKWITIKTKRTFGYKSLSSVSLQIPV